MRFAHISLASLACLLVSSNAEAYATQAPQAARYLSRWIQRLEARVAQARESKALSVQEFDRMKMGVAIIKAKRDEALEDGMVTVKEREAIRRMIGALNMEVAEARFGPRDERETVVAAGDDRDRSRDIRPRRSSASSDENAGTRTVVPSAL